MDQTPKKYSRRIAIRNGRVPPEFARGIWSPTIRDWNEVVEDWVSIAKRRHLNKFAMFKLQMSLLMDIVTSEEAISQYLNWLADPKKAAESSDEEDIAVSVRFWERELEAQKILLVALRDIGDGIAWRTLHYNRPLLQILGLHESVGPTQFGQGLLSELHELSDITTDDSISGFFLHAITNIARVGDITSVDDNGQVEFAEVKSKKNPRGKKWKERLDRQIIRLDNLTQIANDGVGLIDTTGIVVRMVDATPKLSLKKIRSVITDAHHNGLASRIILPYLALTVANFGIKFEQDAFPQLHERTTLAIKKPNDVTIPTSSLDSFSFSPHRAPYSIYPLPPNIIADILLGKIVLFFDFNISFFFRELKQAGWQVVRSIMDSPQTYNPKTDSFCVLKKGTATVEIPPSFFARLMSEGMSIKSVLDICDHVAKQKSSGQTMIYGFSGENNNWE